MIVGIDEVGRGAWAGPLVVGAVLLGGAQIQGLTDSKKLTKRQRETLDREIRQKATAIGLGWVSARHIDRIGLSAALKLASQRAVAHIRADYKEIIIDGTIRLIEDPRVTLMKKADLLVPCVSAASIVAKVARDNYMKHADEVFPGYAFDGHVGYGTLLHRQAIERQGVSPLHRLSFAPLKKYQGVVETVSAKPKLDTVTSKHIGDKAEQAAEQYLRESGHEILDRNWRTKFCEIDIVSKKAGKVYFTEVKYRRSSKQGDGIDAITAKKLRRMSFAAELYAARYQLNDCDLCLAAAAVSGEPPRIEEFLELG